MLRQASPWGFGARLSFVRANVCFWHLADIDADDEHVRFWG
jgi:hypothetical protein